MLLLFYFFTSTPLNLKYDDDDVVVGQQLRHKWKLNLKSKIKEEENETKNILEEVASVYWFRRYLS